MKKTVNPYLIESLLFPLAGEADDDERTDYFSGFDVNNEVEMRKIIEKYLLPEFKEASSIYQEQAKQSLAYFLTTESIDFKRIIQSLLLPFDPSHHGKKWFIWIWEIFFRNDNYHISDVSQYSIVEDVYEPIRLKMKK